MSQWSLHRSVRGITAPGTLGDTLFPQDCLNHSSSLYCSGILLGQPPRSPFVLEQVTSQLGRPHPCTHLSVTEPRHGVHILLLDHEGSQIGCIAGKEDDSKEGPHENHDLAGGAPRILHWHGVVEHQGPQQPDGFPNGEG